jgi:hypothetical protein
MANDVENQQEPPLVRKVILAGTGPAGGAGIDKVTSITFRDITKGALTFRHPEYYLYFPSRSRPDIRRHDTTGLRPGPC